MPKFNIPDREILAFALIGLNQKLTEIDEKIAGIRRDIGEPTTRATAKASPNTGQHRRLSAAARRRIAAAQKKRWAEFHKSKPAA